MLDCHTHIYPRLPDYDDLLPESLKGLLRQEAVTAAERFARGIYGMVTRGIEPIRLDARRLATLRRQKQWSVQQAADATMNLATAPQILLNGSVEDLLAAMKRSGVDRAVVIAAAPIATNAWTLQKVRSAPCPAGRLIPVAHVPRLAAASNEGDWGAAFEALVGDGFAGFKIHPNLDGYGAEHVAYRAMFEVAKRHDKPIILHTGSFAAVGYRHLRTANPFDYASLFDDYPTVRVCLAHMHRDYPEVAWDVMQSHEQVFADTSWQPPEAVKAAVNAVGVERLLLGSDWPLLHPDMQYEAVEALRKAVSATVYDQVTVANAEAFLGPGAAAQRPEPPQQRAAVAVSGQDQPAGGVETPPPALG